MSIGEKIKQLRKTNELTQQEFAEKLYISFQSPKLIAFLIFIKKSLTFSL